MTRDSRNAKERRAHPRPDSSFVDPVIRTVTDTAVLSNRGFYNIIDKSFSSIASGQGAAVSLANYGSFDPVAGTFSANVFRKIRSPFSQPNKDLPGKKLYLNLNASGSIIGSNTGVIFSDTKFNSGITVTGKLHIPIGKNSIVMNGFDADTLTKKKKQLELQRYMEKRKVWQMLYIGRAHDFIQSVQAKLQTDSLTLRQLIADSTRRFREIAAARAVLSHPELIANRQIHDTLIKKYGLQTDSVLTTSTAIDNTLQAIYLHNRQYDSASIMERVIEFDNDPSSGKPPYPLLQNSGKKRYTAIDLAYDKLLDTLEYNVEVEPYHLVWLAIIGSYSRNDYHTYYDSLPFSQRLSNPTYSIFNYGAEYNMLHTGRVSKWYVNIGLLRIGNNNIADLSTSSLSKGVRTSLADTAFSSSSDYKVYTKAIKEYKAWKLYANYYYFFDPGTTQSIHIIGETEFRNTNIQPVNIGLGYLFSFKNSKDNTVINTELYGKFMDVSGALPDSKGYSYNRIQVGLQFGIPFSLPTNK